MGISTTNEDVFISAPPPAVFEALELLPRVSSWWRGARTSGTSERITADIPSFRAGRRVRFEARIDGIRPGEGLVWWLDRGELAGRGEFWLEPFKDGTIVHYYLDVDPGPAGRMRSMPARVRRHRWAVRRGLNDLKDSLEARAWQR
ncbi:MAG: hypothetical protein ABR548_07825 [Actinomycetota bacterium]|nr:hypothetical protein [Actinomycetota bacterium]